MSAKLIFRSGAFTGKYLSLPLGKTTVFGRNRDIDMPLPDLKLSRRHCTVSAREDGFFVADLGSTNGTYVNGQKISDDEIKIEEFDRIIIGDTEMELSGGQLPDTYAAISREDSEAFPEQIFGSPNLDFETSHSSAAVQVGAGAKSDASSADSRLIAAMREMLLPLPPLPSGSGSKPAVQAVTTEQQSGYRRPATEAIVLPNLTKSLVATPLAPAQDGSSLIQPPSKTPSTRKTGFLQRVDAAPQQTTPATQPQNRPQPGAPATAQPTVKPATGNNPPVLTKPVKSSPTLDDILAGLDGEPMVVDMNKKSRAQVFEGGPFVRQPKQ